MTTYLRVLGIIFHFHFIHYVVVVVLGFYVPPTAKVIRRRDLGLKSHPKDWRSPGSNPRPLVYKAGSLTARPQRLLYSLRERLRTHKVFTKDQCFYLNYYKFSIQSYVLDVY